MSKRYYIKQQSACNTAHLSIISLKEKAPALKKKKIEIKVYTYIEIEKEEYKRQQQVLAPQISGTNRRVN